MTQDKQHTSKAARPSLSEKQELLLSRFSDGECSRIKAFFARRLLARNREAQVFFSDLQELRDQCSSLTSPHPEVPANLWARIDARIEQEERAARFLGNRNPERQPHASFLEWLSTRHVLVGGLSGAAAAAAFLFVVSRPSQLLTFSAPAASPLAGNQLVQPASIGAAATPRMREALPSTRRYNSLEVDWMRANGSLRLIPDPSGSSAIIWVRKRPAQLGQKGSGPALIPTPLGLAPTSSAHMASPQRRLDEHMSPSAK